MHKKRLMMMKNKEMGAGVEERPIRVSNTFKRCGGGFKANSLLKRFLKKPSGIRLSGVPPYYASKNTKNIDNELGYHPISIMPLKTPQT